MCACITWFSMQAIPRRTWYAVQRASCVHGTTQAMPYGRPVPPASLTNPHPNPQCSVSLELTLTEEELLSLKSATADADEQKNDLSLLSDVNAGSVLHNMRQRYELQEIYTSIGPQILIAVNPFEPLPVCGEDFMLELQSRESADLPPHAYTTARYAYEAMCASRVPQSILIGGESGAGKTETTKIAMVSMTRPHPHPHSHSHAGSPSPPPPPSPRTHSLAGARSSAPAASLSTRGSTAGSATCPTSRRSSTPCDTHTSTNR